jgi:hypothetical protein
MIRKFKVLGLALVAVFAMSAVVASAASATNFTAASYPVTISGSQTTQHVFTAAGGETKCSTASFSGSATGASETQTITPTYEGCTSFGISSTVTMNGCDYLFHAAASGSNTGTVDLVCPTNKEVTIDVGSVCVIHIPPFTNKGSITYTNNAGDIDVSANETGITAKITRTSFFCPVAEQTVTNATYTGNTTMQGSSNIDVG